MIISRVLLMALLMGCQNEQAKEKLDGKVLIEQKCSKCHNLDIPPNGMQVLLWLFYSLVVL